MAVDEETNRSPMVTIITVSMNTRLALEETILSVISQTYSNRDFIVIDGGSSDGSIDVIADYKEHISYSVSESDKGIYDAMNKGTKKASGEWIVFMNAGDVFFENSTLEKTLTSIPSDSDLVYGDTLIHYWNDFERISKARVMDGSVFWRGLPFVHQSLLCRTEILRQHLFDLRYKIVADHHFCCWAYTKGYKFHQLHQVVSKVSAGLIAKGFKSTTGGSDIKKLDAARDLYNSSKDYTNSIVAKIFFAYSLMKARTNLSVKKSLPIRLVKRLTLIKYRFFQI